jgi:arylsulfatase A-like enzyme
MALLAAPLPAAAGPVNKPTVLLVTIDTIRADRLSCYGHGRHTTPVIDRLTGEGLLFQNTVAFVPLTTPSHASIFTGLHPRSHAVLGNSWQLGESVKTMAEHFRDAGYATAAFVSAVVLDPRCGLDRGFDHYSAVARPGPVMALHTPWSEGPPGEGDDPAARSLRVTGRQRQGQETVDEALAWMTARRGGAPLFVWVHLYDPHQPYDPPQPYRELFGAERGARNLSAVIRPGFEEREFEHTDQLAHEEMARRHGRFQRGARRPEGSIITAGSLNDDERKRINELYDGEVAYADYQVGRLLAWLKGRGLYEKSVVAVMGDHGETLGEHLDYYGHHHVLYDTSLHIPLIIRPPGGSGGEVLPVIATTADVAPTLLRAAGLGSPSGLDGHDLLGGPVTQPVYCETYLGVSPREIPEEVERRAPSGPFAGGIHQHAVLDGRWKLVLAGGSEQSPMLFDFECDPGEQTDVAGSHEALVKVLSGRWQRWCEAHLLPQRSRDRREAPGADEEMKDKLRQLGYVE